LIIGGSQVYEAFLPLEPTIHLTLVEGAFTGDIFFPAAVLDSPEWEVLHEERWPADAENPHDASYLVLRPKGERTG
jgi:dihydrofolate reductase